MTNIEKVKRILDAGHWVKATDTDGASYKIYDQPEDGWVVSYKIDDGELELFQINDFEDCTIEVIQPKKPNYKVGEKVKVLNIAREIEEFNLLDSDQQEMVGGVYTIESIDCYWIRLKCNSGTHCCDDSYTFPSWCLAPYFDDEEKSDMNRIISGKEAKIVIDGKEYTCVIK